MLETALPAGVEQLHQERRVVLLHLRQGDAQRRPVRVVVDGGGCVTGTGRGALAAVGGIQLVVYLGHCNFSSQLCI